MFLSLGRFCCMSNLSLSSILVLTLNLFLLLIWPDKIKFTLCSSSLLVLAGIHVLLYKFVSISTVFLLNS